MGTGEPRSFGAALRAAREDAGRGLDDLAASTRVQRRYLEALEAEEWASVPGGVIGRGFVRLAAKELGLPAAPFLELYGQARAGEDPVTSLAPPEPEWTVDFRRERGPGPVLLALLFLAGAGLGIWIWSPWSVAPRPPAEAPAPAEREAAAPAQSPAPPADLPAPPPAAPPPPPAPSPVPEVHRLEVLAVEKVWVQVVADGGSVDERLLQPGQSRAYEVSRQASLRLGNAGGVRLTWDGQALKVPGAAGRVMTVELPKALEELRP